MDHQHPMNQLQELPVLQQLPKTEEFPILAGDEEQFPPASAEWPSHDVLHHVMKYFTGDLNDRYR